MCSKMTSKREVIEEAAVAPVPTLKELCQATIIKMLEDISMASSSSANPTSSSILAAAKSSSMRNRLIHDLCKYLPDNLLGNLNFNLLVKYIHLYEGMIGKRYNFILDMTRTHRHSVIIDAGAGIDNGRGAAVLPCARPPRAEVESGR
jgi:hypothetical protein